MTEASGLPQPAPWRCAACGATFTDDHEFWTSEDGQLFHDESTADGDILSGCGPVVTTAERARPVRSGRRSRPR